MRLAQEVLNRLAVQLVVEAFDERLGTKMHGGLNLVARRINIKLSQNLDSTGKKTRQSIKESVEGKIQTER